MKQTYEELERERNELAAQVERLRGALGVLICQAEQVDSWEQFPSRWIDDAQSVANEQPSTALAALKAEWLSEVTSDNDENILPALGSTVYFRHTSSGSLVPYAVTGFYALQPSHTDDDTCHRVFVVGRHPDGYKNARLLNDVHLSAQEAGDE